MERRTGPRMGVGSVSLVVIFVVLCLAVFALLSVSTAYSNRELSQTSALAVSDYYKAEFICAEKTQAVQEAAESGASIDALVQLAGDLSMQAQAKDSGTLLSFGQTIDQTRALSVSLFVDEGQVYVVQWQVVSIGEWVPDDSITVWTE